MRLAFETLVLCAATLVVNSAALADGASSPQPIDNGWTVSISLYVWLPIVNGSFNGKSFAIGPGEYLSKIQSGAPLSGQVRKGRVSVFTDAIYANAYQASTTATSVTGSGGVTIPVTERRQLRLNAAIWTLAPGIAVVKTPATTLDAFTGFRYAAANTSVGYQLGAPINTAGAVSQSQRIWDWISGVRGRIGGGEERIFIPYYLDAGTGTSAFTWQGALGAGYSPSGHCDFALTYRILGYDEPIGSTFQQVHVKGPALAVTLHF
jgi:hypothetical protein